MPNTMPTLCMDRFVSVDICDLRQAGTHAGIWPSSILETIGYKQISTGIKQKGPKSKTGRQRGNKDYESAALTIELRARAGSSADFLIVSGPAIIAPQRRLRVTLREPPRRGIFPPQP